MTYALVKSTRTSQVRFVYASEHPLTVAGEVPRAVLEQFSLDKDDRWVVTLLLIEDIYLWLEGLRALDLKGGGTLPRSGLGYVDAIVAATSVQCHKSWEQ